MSLKESDLAKLVIEWFESNGYEVYKEVINTKRKNRADIIVVKDGEYTVIETKLSFGLTVIEQVFKWKPYSHYSYCCIPKSKSRNSRRFGYDMCKDYGVGVMEVDKYGNISIIHESSFTKDPELPKLYEEQKDQEAGSKPSKDSYITPFKITCKKLIEYISNSNSDQSLLTSIKNIDHHYKSDSSAKNALTKLINMGVIP